MEQKDLICIGCPLGCMISVEMDDGMILRIQGNGCKKGEAYAKAETTNPVRTVTSSVRVEGGIIAMVSVKTQAEIPKDKIRDCMEEIKNIRVKAPIHIGDVIIKEVAGTNVSVVATKEIPVK